MRFSFIPAVLTLVSTAAAQTITDVWQTTWDRAQLLSNPGGDTVTFGAPGDIGSADIVINDTSTQQTMAGFGSSLTDSSAQLFAGLKSQNEDNYWKLLDYLFNTTNGADSAGFSYVRVPLGASDFSANVYSFDNSGGPSLGSTITELLSTFNFEAAPSDLLSTLQDIMSVNSDVRLHVLPWSPPAWMKDSNSMNGGSLNDQYTDAMASYLLKSLQGFKNAGLPVYAMSIQNEPMNSDGTYPTCNMPVETEAAIGKSLRSLMDSNGFNDTKLIGFEHNWSNAGDYPVQLMQQAGDAFDGVSFHCYEGDVSNQEQFTSQFPDKEVYFTECSGTLGSDWWTDIKWYMDNLFIGGPQYGSSSGLMWNLALDSNGGPKLPGTDSCGGAGCRGVVQINDDGSWDVNQEFYALGQAAKAVIPVDPNGPYAQHVDSSVGGDSGWALLVSAYATGRATAGDQTRYSLVVTNWNDGSDSGWNPQSVDATIEFRGQQATYTFPVGVTTLSWYANGN